MAHASRASPRDPREAENAPSLPCIQDCPRPPAADPVDPWEALNIHIIPTKVARVVPEEAITVTRRMPPVSCPGLGSVGSETSAELFPCRKLELR